jgi:hypothetical protein
MSATAPEAFVTPFLTEWSPEAELAHTRVPAQAQSGSADGPAAGPLRGGQVGHQAAVLADPFRLASESFFAGEAGAPSATSAAAAELFAELHNEAFTEALSDLMNEAQGVVAELPQAEAPATARNDRAAAALGDHLEPLAQAAEQMLEGVERELEAQASFGVEESELQQLMEAHTPTVASPSHEGFLGALKGIVSRVANVAKNVAVGPFMALLRKAVRPLLQSVIRFALGRIPAPLRGIAQQVATKVLGLLGETPQLEHITELGELDGLLEQEGGGQSWEAAAPVTELEQNFRAHLTAALLAPEDGMREAIVDHFATEAQAASVDELEALQDARERFVTRVAVGGQDELQPAMEELLPALLALRPALSTAINVIGRDRVTGWIANLLTPLLAKFVQQPLAGQLAQTLVGAGLSLIGESAEADNERPGSVVPVPVVRALAQAVEETVAGLPADTEALADEATATAATLEAFEAAAPTVIPAQMIRPALRQSTTGDGAVFRPVQRTAYLRYTSVPTISITPAAASNVVLPGGVRLRSFLRDRYGVKPDHTVRARVHIFQAVPGTRLAHIVAGERRVPGLGPQPQGGMRSAITKIHPLTRQAAAVLLSQPALGRDVSAKFLADRHRTAVGARYFYLEPLGLTDTGAVPTPRAVPVYLPGQRAGAAVTRPGAPLAPGVPAPTRPIITTVADHRGRASEFNVTVNLRRDEVRVAFYLSESRSQELTRLINSRAPLPVLLRVLREVSTDMVDTLKRTGPLNHIRIEQESLEAEALDASDVMRTLATRVLAPLMTWTLARISDLLAASAQDFVRATQDPKHGVTLVVAFRRLPLVAKIRAALRGNLLALRGITASAAVPKDADVQVVAGFAA